MRHQLRPLDALAPLVITSYVAAMLFACYRALGRQGAGIYRILAICLLAALLLPFVSYVWYSLIYFYPLLCVAILSVAVLWSALPARVRAFGALLIVCYCALCINAVWQSAQFVRDGVAHDDPLVFAVGGGAPLSSQLAIIEAAQNAAADSGELIVALRPVEVIAHEQLVHVVPLLSRMPTRFVNLNEPHRIFPAQTSFWLIDTTQTPLPPALRRG